MKSTIRLFKAVPITATITKKDKEINNFIMENTIKKGFIFSPQVIANYTEEELKELINIIDEELGLSSEQMNSTFHKSWNKVKTASMEQLVMEQIIHYMTTYGFKDLGIYSDAGVYIPNEKLDIPNLDIDGINLIVIKGYTKSEIKKKLVEMLQSGIALKEDTIKDCVDIGLYVKLTEEEIETIKNKEVKISLYSELGLVPKNPVEFLRFIIFKSTEKTLLIKDRTTITAIKESEIKNVPILLHFIKYKEKYGLEKLATIFYRFKPLFLAFKTHKQLNSYINKIRRLAKKYHKPMPEDFLNEITAKLTNGIEIDIPKLEKELNKANTFRKIRLAYALKFRTKDVDSILYKVRNGKGYAKEFIFLNQINAKKILGVVLNSIIADVRKNVKGKKIFIPENMNYTLPATEKQFTGYFPSGSYVTVTKDMVFGVHWKNVDGRQTDLDLSLINPESGKIGWDSNYRDEKRNILFSGDITDAPNGATELFYVKRQKVDANILLVNYYNYDEAIPAPFKIIVGQEQISNLKENYVVNPNNVKAVAKTKIDKKQKILGILVTTTNECRFYFAETYVGNSITSSSNPFVEHTRKYLFDFYTNGIKLTKMLEKAGAILITEKEECDIDLSPEVLEKDTIINLVK